MSEQLNHSDIVSITPQNEPAETAAILKDIQQRLSFLERKIDTLLNQSSSSASSDRPAFQRRPFGKSGRPFNRFNKGRPSGPRENNFRDRESRPEGFSSSPQPRHFDKPRGEAGQGFGGKKKKFFHRGKGPR